MIDWNAVALMIVGVIGAFIFFVFLPAWALDEMMHGRKKE